MSAPAASMSVREALRLPVLRKGLPQVVAGHANLDRPIRWVHAGEVANIASLLVGGELLLTTGMGIGAKAAQQRAFVQRLADRDVAALIIELGYAFTDVPQPLTQAAEARGLPLVALQREIRFVAVTEAIHTHIVSSDYALLRRGEHVQRHLSALILDGEGIPAVLAALATTLGAPVFLEDGEGRLLVHAAAPGYDLDPIDVWEAARTSKDQRATRAATVRSGGHAPDGRLLVADLQPSAVPLADAVLGHAGDIVALAMLRERQDEELLARERADLLCTLADGRVAPGTVARALGAAGLARAGDALLPVAATPGWLAPTGGGTAGAATGGWSAGASGAAGAGERAAAGGWSAGAAGAAGTGERAAPARTTGGTAAVTAAEWGRAMRDAHAALAAAAVDGVVGHRPDGTVLCVASLRDPDARATTADAVATALRDTLAALGATGVVVAAGRATPAPGLGEELQATEESAAGAHVLPEKPWHDATALELRRLLWRRRGDADIAALVDRVLGPLIEHDRRRRNVLLPTLEALLANGGRKAETARALHLNRQALYNRITRIEALLGVDLTDAEQLLTIHFAVYARLYIDT